jgi:hypothetical protein
MPWAAHPVAAEHLTSTPHRAAVAADRLQAAERLQVLAPVAVVIISN